MPKYDAHALEEGIQQAKNNIRIFEDQIERERHTITEYRILIDDIKREERKKKE